MSDEKTVKPKLKETIGRLFDKAFSDDPMIACQAVGKLIVLLNVAMQQLGTREYDKLLETETLGANRAWHELTFRKEPGLAMQTTRNVLKNIGFFAFDPRFSTLEPDAFVGRK